MKTKHWIVTVLGSPIIVIGFVLRTFNNLVWIGEDLADRLLFNFPNEE